MRIVGLDLSLSASGIVRLDEAGRVIWGHVLPSDPKATDVVRFAQITGQVMERVVDQGFQEPCCDLVAMEDVYASRNLLTFKRLAQLSILMQYRLWRKSIPYELMTPAEWRKLMFGLGSKITQKDQTRVAVARRYSSQLGALDPERADENVLDAFCVAQAAYRRHVEGVVLERPARRPRPAKELKLA
jgi:Holliday junction resolvasome RuvABC endonuclease subunit